ncbi:MAG: Nif3-like dinuclear metal center hexameric protein, partial [Planctomycetaceae bacterium]
MKTGQIIAFLREFAPPVLAEDWDNTGLLIGRESSDISRILTCLTLTPDVATEAIESRVQLIVT